MTVSRYATQAGKAYETKLMQHLREQGWDVERLRLSGAEDEGDLLLRVLNKGFQRYVIEAKRTKSLDLSGWVKQARVERDNYKNHRNFGSLDPVGFVVVHYARGKGIGQSYVTTTLDEWLSRL